MIVYSSSGLAEIIAILLLPLLAALLGSAVTAALTAALTTIAVLSLVHGLGLGVAIGSHRLERSGHWLARPLLFSAGFTALALASLSSNAVLIVAVLDPDDASWWLLLAPTSAVVVQLASVVILGLWAVDRVVRIVGDFASQVGVGDGERASLFWDRLKIGGRWLAIAAWVLAALALFFGSLLGCIVTIPLFAVAGEGTTLALSVHGGLMLVGVVAGGILLVTRVARLRAPRESSRQWSARIRGRQREGFAGKSWRVLLSLLTWLLGEAVLWVSSAAAVLLALAFLAAALDPELGMLSVVFGIASAPISVGGLWLARTGGVLRGLREPVEA